MRIRNAIYSYVMAKERGGDSVTDKKAINFGDQGLYGYVMNPVFYTRKRKQPYELRLDSGPLDEGIKMLSCL